MTTTLEQNTVGTPLRWSSNTITWSIAGSNLPSQPRNATPYTGFMTAQSATYVPLIQQAEAAWSSVANLQFQQVADGPNVDIRFGFGNFLPTYIGFTWYQYDANAKFLPGTVVQIENPAHVPLSQQAAGLQWNGYTTTVVQDLEHEIGHALGLGHSPDDNAAVMWPVLGTGNRTADAGDVAAIRSLYGARSTPTAPTAPITPTTPTTPIAPPPSTDPLTDLLAGLLGGDITIFFSEFSEEDPNARDFAPLASDVGILSDEFSTLAILPNASMSEQDFPLPCAMNTALTSAHDASIYAMTDEQHAMATLQWLPC